MPWRLRDELDRGHQRRFQNTHPLVEHRVGNRQRQHQTQHIAVGTAAEQQQIDRANKSGNTPVVFIHGLWVLPSSWQNWADLFEKNGYAPVTPIWPGFVARLICPLI